MPAEQDYRAAICALDRAGLVALWRQIEQRSTPGWASGKAFEYLVLRAFELDGAEVVWPYRVSLGGNALEQVDGVIYFGSLAALVESKDQAAAVNFGPIAKLRQQLARRPPSLIGCCLSVSGFTLEATVLAARSSPQNVLLWDGEEVAFALKNGKMFCGLRAKFRHAVEYALPDFKLQTP